MAVSKVNQTKKNEKVEQKLETFLLDVLACIFFSFYDPPLRLRKRWASSLQLLLWWLYSHMPEPSQGLQ
jgi:hypothetical protein